MTKYKKIDSLVDAHIYLKNVSSPQVREKRKKYFVDKYGFI